jgi:hypothetical protein
MRWEKYSTLITKCMNISVFMTSFYFYEDGLYSLFMFKSELFFREEFNFQMLFMEETCLS